MAACGSPAPAFHEVGGGQSPAMFQVSATAALATGAPEL
jgi:hypothetical protein